MSFDLTAILRIRRQMIKDEEMHKKKEDRDRKKLHKAWVSVSRAAARKAREKTRKKLQKEKRVSALLNKKRDEETAAQATHELVFLKKMLKKSRKRAEIAGYLFELDIQWLVQTIEAKGSICEICGGALEFKIRDKDNKTPTKLFVEFPSNASLDQRVHSAGYTKENVQVTHVRCNLLKLDMPMRDLVELCAKIVRHHSPEGVLVFDG